MRNLLKEWDNLKGKFFSNQVVLFLDYDGTLAPIVKKPELAVISHKVRKILKAISDLPDCHLAIISGRPLSEIKRLVGISNIIYSGNHGLELEGPKIKFISPFSLSYKGVLKEIKVALIKRSRDIKGVFIEDKGLSLSFHFRLVKKQKQTEAKTIFHETIIHYLARGKVKVKHGKMVFEVRPPVDWDKGKAVLWLVSRFKFSLDNKALLPVYIGDDVTDEDAFAALRNKGVTVFVGSPKAKSKAEYFLKGPGEVKDLLKKILKLKAR